jgi:dTDP-4-amino-4,6-dideoxygalactose transaminase
MKASTAKPSRSAAIENLVRKYKLPEPIWVTRPAMPRLTDYHQSLQRIWDSRWLTNVGQFHKEFEQRLSEYLGVEHVSLFCNGTIALLVALQALRINGGEVITTPFTFPATVHVLYWNRIRPVFCDIDEKTLNLDPKRVETLISPDTKAILPVHVFGNPCAVEELQEIADRHGLHVIYDAAHAFGVRYRDSSILEFGDMSVLSFHATKLFTSVEGGAVISKSAVQKRRVDFLKNFGIADEETVIGPGINGKMNEFQAAFGLLELDVVDQEISNRGKLAQVYRQELSQVPGITFPEKVRETRHNYCYFPVLVDHQEYGMNRDELHTVLKQFNIHPRKYFYPLCSSYSCYSALPSADPNSLPIANRVAKQVLCLPLYGTLDEGIVHTICMLLREVPRCVA